MKLAQAEAETETEAGSAQPLAPIRCEASRSTLAFITSTAYAKIEGTVTLNAGDLVSVRARASNKIDVGGLPVVNLIDTFRRRVFLCNTQQNRWPD